MNLASTVLGWINNIFGITPVGGASSSQSGPGAKFVNNNPPVYPDPQVETFVSQGFAGNASVYSIVTKASKKFGHINRGVYKINGEEGKKAFKRYSNLCRAGLSTKAALLNAVRLRNKAYNEGEVVEGELNSLIMRPNKRQGQDSFFELANINYMVTGEAFIWLNRGDVDPELDDSVVAKMKVLEMYVLPSSRIEIVPDTTDPFEIKGYWFNLFGAKGARWFIRACDIIHWKKANPVWDDTQSRSHLRGLSPLKAGLKVLTQDDDSTDAMVAMYQNGGAKAIVFDKSLSKLTPEQETQLRGVIDRKLNNPEMKGGVAALQGEWGMLDLGLSSTDQDLIKGSEQAFTKLCHLFDVPAALFLTDQTYENKSAALKDWLTNSVIPAACSLRDEMNRVLLPAFGVSGIMIDNDISDIPELQEDLGKLVTWMAQFPWMTPNQKLEYLGEEPSTEDGMDEVWVPNNIVKLSDANMPDVTAGLDAQGVNDYNQVTNKPAVNA